MGNDPPGQALGVIRGRRAHEKGQTWVPDTGHDPVTHPLADLDSRVPGEDVTPDTPCNCVPVVGGKYEGIEGESVTAH
jgi:hypothetical protein